MPFLGAVLGPLHGKVILGRFSVKTKKKQTLPRKDPLWEFQQRTQKGDWGLVFGGGVYAMV